MTFPAVVTRSSGATAGVTAHTVTLPTGIVNGDLIIVAFVEANASTITWPAGWTTDLHSGNDISSTSRIEIHRRVADGSEGASISITTGSAVNDAYRVWRISGFHPSTAPEAAGTAAYSTNPNPPTLDPAGWAAEDTLWLVAHCNNTAKGQITGFPASYTDTATAGVSASSPSMGVAERQLNASSEDPGTFTVPIVNWRAVTIAIRPAADASPKVIHRPQYTTSKARQRASRW